MYQELHVICNGNNETKYLNNENIYIDRFKLLSISVPLTWNTTDSSNNSIVYSRNGSTKTAVLPPSSYNSVSLPSALQKALNDSSDQKDFSVTYESQTRKLTISTTGQAFQIRPASEGTTAYPLLGMSLSDPATPSGTNYSFYNSDFTQTAPLLLTSSTLSSPSVRLIGKNQNSILSVVPLTSASGTLAYYQHTGSYLSCGKTLSTFNFSLVNSRTLQPVRVSTFSVSLAILTDADDPE